VNLDVDETSYCILMEFLEWRNDCLLTTKCSVNLNYFPIIIVPLFVAADVSASSAELGYVTVTVMVMGMVLPVAVLVNTSATRGEVLRAPNILLHSGLRYKPH
jgi:hypothetical protein